MIIVLSSLAWASPHVQLGNITSAGTIIQQVIVNSSNSSNFWDNIDTPLELFPNCTGTDKYSVYYPNNNTLGCTTDLNSGGTAAITGDFVYTYNVSGVLNFNETKMNNTIKPYIGSSVGLDNSTIVRNGTLNTSITAVVSQNNISMIAYILAVNASNSAGSGYTDTWINDSVNSSIQIGLLAVNNTANVTVDSPSIIRFGNTTWVTNLITQAFVKALGFTTTVDIDNATIVRNMANCTGTDKYSLTYPNGTLGCTADSSSSYIDTWINTSVNSSIDIRMATNNISVLSYILVVNASNPGGAAYLDAWINTTTNTSIDQRILTNNNTINNSIQLLVNNANTSMKSYIDLNNASLDDAYVNRSKWTSIDNYPAACSAGTFATTVGDTLTCATPLSDNFALNTSVVNITTNFAGSVTGTYKTTRVGNNEVLINAANMTAGTVADARLPVSQSGKNFTTSVGIYGVTTKLCLNSACTAFINATCTQFESGGQIGEAC